jgi:hypothetical protein
VTRALRIVAVAAAPALLALHRIDAADVWMQLATGRLVARTGSLPAHDPFAAPPPAPWLVHDWLASVLLSAVHAVAGAPGLVLLSVALTTAAVVLPLVLAARDRLPPAPFEIAALVATLVAYERFFVRPEMFSFLALTLWVQALARGAPRRGRDVAALALLQAVWANLHAAFVLGPALAALAVAGDLFDVRRRTGRWQRPPLARALLPLVALTACGVNPYGPRLLVHLAQAGGNAASLRRGIVEWQPTFAAPIGSDITLVAFTASFVLVAVACVWGLRRGRGFELLAVAMLAVLACTARRHLALWAFGALPLAAAWCARAAAARRVVAGAAAPAPGFLDWIAATARRRTVLASRLVPVLALVLAADVARGAFHRRFGPPRTLGWGVSDADHPIGAAEFVARHGLPGPLFNNIAAGGYLAWRFAPQLPVWVDGRLLDAERFRAYRQCLESPAAFDALAAARGFRLVVFALQPYAPRGLMQHLYASPAWRLTFLDGEGAVFVREDAGAPPALRLEAPLAAGDAPVGRPAAFGRACDPGPALRRGRVLFDLGFPAAARADLARAVQHCGRDADAWYGLGVCHAALGDLAAARDCWQTALRLDARHPGARAALARVR